MEPDPELLPDPVFYETTIPRQADEITDWIKFLVTDRHAWQMKPYPICFFLHGDQPPGKLRVFAHAYRTPDQKEALGQVMEFEITPIGDETILQAICFDAQVTEHFARLWQDVINGSPPGQEKGKSPRSPKSIKAKNDWRVRWEKIKPEWRRGKKNYTALANWLTETCNLKTSPETVADIIAAGEAKILD